MFCTFCDLRDKEVVNIRDGKRLGYIIDLEFDICSGRIIRIILPPCGKLFSISSKNNICIPWDHIEKIGEDTILVRYNEIIPIGRKHK